MAQETTATGPRTVGVVPHPTKDVSGSLAVLRRWGAATAVRLVGPALAGDRLGPGVEPVEPAELQDTVDAVVALGGDGTMLGAMRLVAARPVPVLGVNYGNLGFLVEVEPGELEAALARLGAGDFQTEPHHALELRLRRDGHEEDYLAFNDVAVVRRPGLGVVSADLAVDGTAFGYYRADGLVVATSAGSTAYSYAAGGPMVSPSLAVMLVTPVASMAGIDRTVVLGHQERLTLTLAAGTRSAAVEVDGQVLADVGAGSEIGLGLRQDAGLVLRLNAQRHANRGRLKLSLLDLPLRPAQIAELVPDEVRDRLAHGFRMP